MRVCILTTSFPLYEGIAVGIHVVEQARHLVKLGATVDVLAPHHLGASRREVVDGIRVHRFPYVFPEQWQTLCYGAGIPTNLKTSHWAKIQLPLLLFALLVNATRLARKTDIIHAHWSLTGLAGVLAGKLLNKPVVLMMHGAEIYVLKGNPFIKFILREADQVLCNSTFTLSKILEISQPRAYRVISPGVDVDRFRPDVDLSVFFEREPSIPRNRPIIFTLGKFIERKGFSYLVDALALLRGRANPHLMIGGRGPLKERLKRQAEELGLAERVTFLDYIPDECLPAYYAAADVFVLPSVVDDRDDTEGLGVVLLEALACETPCVASNVGGIPDIIKDKHNGFLVEPGSPEALADRLSRLIEDPALGRNMGKRGRLFVKKHFSWEKQASDLLEVYSKLSP